MDRREFLAAGATLAATVAGGCTGCARSPTASFSMTAVTDAEIARKATEDFSADSEGYRFVREAVENGSATVRDTDVRIPADVPFVHDDAVYRLSHEVVASEPATSFSFTLNLAEGNFTESETVRYEQLPEIDRAKLDLGADPFLGFGSSLLYTREEIPESMLVPEPEYPILVWDEDTRGRFEVGGSSDTALNTYRYVSEQVAPSAAAYGRRLREEVGFKLSGLSDGERRIVEQAVENEHGYTVPSDESPPDALWRLAERFRPRRGVHDDPGDSPSMSGTYVVRYEGSWYWTGFYVDGSAFTSATDGG